MYNKHEKKNYIINLVSKLSTISLIHKWDLFGCFQFPQGFIPLGKLFGQQKHLGKC